MLAVLLLAMCAVGQVSRDPPGRKKRPHVIDQAKTALAARATVVRCHVTANAHVQERHIYGLSC